MKTVVLAPGKVEKMGLLANGVQELSRVDNQYDGSTARLDRDDQKTSIPQKVLITMIR